MNGERMMYKDATVVTVAEARRSSWIRMSIHIPFTAYVLVFFLVGLVSPALIYAKDLKLSPIKMIEDKTEILQSRKEKRSGNRRPSVPRGFSTKLAEGKIILWEAIAEPSKRFPTCHCSAILELANGDILVGYYAGPGEARPGTAWVLARRRPRARRFGPLHTICKTPGKPEGNGILFQTKDGTVLIIYGTMQGKLYGEAGPGIRWTTCDLRIRRSQDNGKTWSEPSFIEEKLGHVVRNNPIRLKNGDIIFGTEHCIVHSHSRFWVSRDEGQTWKMTGEVSGEENEQPAVIQRGDGSLLAFLRPSGDTPNIFRSISDDGGHTWSPAEKTGIKCPHSAFSLIKLADGRVVLAWNNHPTSRSDITLAMSEDDGETWPHLRKLVTGQGGFAYPALMQDRNGLIHLTFTNNRRTIDHIVLTPKWITGEGAELPPWNNVTMNRTLGD